jgi:antitoxin component of MazEF toxin-antitoxin module
MDTDETEYFVSFPQDLLEAADLKEGDAVHWIDNNDGSYTIRKSTKPLGSDEC